MQDVWDTFDAVWGDPSQHGGGSAVGAAPSVARPPPMLSIEDGAVNSEGADAEAPVASPSAESVATTQPEQTPEERVLEVG